ncbi:hypothetical protein D9619_003693 [Psilocybe cf. subviscida]|uniref:Uncharacterized protein n=1 Tax=Psilocybe cf. subviscida TaxID=2480587 RepID=A0A8H5EUC2_9AGAR|nr:hypothetical protein D9619_003693 [Psilocybe cf. subviscida]
MRSLVVDPITLNTSENLSGGVYSCVNFERSAYIHTSHQILATRHNVAAKKAPLVPPLQVHRISKKKRIPEASSSLSPAPTSSPESTPALLPPLKKTISPDSSTDIEYPEMAPTHGPDDNGDAVVDFHPTGKMPPAFSKGNITARNIAKFQEDYERYFSIRNIAEDQRYLQVKHTIFPDQIKIWIQENDATLAPLTFVNFIEAMRAEFLDGDWESSHIRLTVRRPMADDESFDAYATSVKINNNLLPAGIKLSNASLRECLRAGWNSALNAEWDCLPRDRQEAITAINQNNLAEWIKKVKALGLQAAAKTTHLARVIEEQVRARIEALEKERASKARSSSSSSTNFVAATIPAGESSSNKRGASANNISERNKARNKTQSKPESSSSSTTSTSKAGKTWQDWSLTMEEKLTLKAYDGCTRCRRYYVYHIHSDCPNPSFRHSADAYRPRLQDFALEEAEYKKKGLRTDPTEEALKARAELDKLHAADASKGANANDDVYDETPAAPKTGKRNVAAIMKFPPARPKVFRQPTPDNPPLPPATASIEEIVSDDMAPPADKDAEMPDQADNDPTSSEDETESEGDSGSTSDNKAKRKTNRDKTKRTVNGVVMQGFKKSYVPHGSDSDTVSTPPPLTGEHLLWSPFIINDGIRTRKARTLLDHGSYTNLIRRDTAIKCGLTIHRLDEPLITGNAINPDEKQEFVHDEYVIIQVSSQNGAWTSLDFIAVVTDSLVHFSKLFAIFFVQIG